LAGARRDGAAGGGMGSPDFGSAEDKGKYRSLHYPASRAREGRREPTKKSPEERKGDLGGFLCEGGLDCEDYGKVRCGSGGSLEMTKPSV